MDKKSLTALIILDGFGYRPEKEYNAILTDGAKNIMGLVKKYPHSLIDASGLDVGLPEGQMGNSEVGHTNIGAGRVVYQELTRITKSAQEGDMEKNEALLWAMNNCLEKGTSLHIMGLLSDGGVHSSYEHLIAILRLAKMRGLERVYVHCYTDGRDTPTDSGIGFVKRLVDDMNELGVGKIATIGGRYYAMDRNSNFDRVEKGYAALVYGEGVMEKDPVEAMRHSYDNGVTDEFILPVVITDEEGRPTATIKKDDSIIFFNFRADRARLITSAFIFEDFEGFERRYGYFPVYFACMTEYRADFVPYVHIAFKPQSLANGMGEYISKLGMTQLRIAEYEKYAHVTFFFNGGREAQYEGEERILVPSPDVATYDLKPEMSAYEVTEKAIESVNSRRFDLMVLNYANPDMVGHTGIMEAAVAAVHAVDECVGKLVKAILKNGGRCIITADHGNCELMMVNGEKMTAHTTNPVPIIYVGKDADKYEFTGGGKLCDISPTLLMLMGLPQPEEMEGHCLLKEKAVRDNA